MSNEADTCREYVLPKLRAAGWDAAPRQIAEQVFFTNGRIVVSGSTARRGPRKFADYVLRLAPDFPIAVVEAKRSRKLPADGLQQAKDYAEILGLKFAYATNGQGIIEFDYTTGRERELNAFPSPDELWSRLQGGALTDAAARKLLTPGYDGADKPRYYQHIAINRAVEAVLHGQRRVLLTLATGTGKTAVAFQIAWKLWSARWNARGLPDKPRILFLADRNKLVDDPKDKDFAPFGDARWKIEGGGVSKSREMYFAIYQALTTPDADGRLPYTRYAPTPTSATRSTNTA
jgi:type I restriction enzyme R subunit